MYSQVLQSKGHLEELSSWRPGLEENSRCGCWKVGSEMGVVIQGGRETQFRHLLSGGPGREEVEEAIEHLSSSIGKKDASRTRIIIAVVVSIVVCITLAVCAGILLIKRTKKQNKEELESTHGINFAESLQYDFSEIKAATDGFSDTNKLGQGGFGVVYKGKLSNGCDIAVKRLSIDSGQGDIEFKNEVLLVAKLQHRNLVRLLGFSIEGRERLLVYEFVENASLDRYIFDPIERMNLDSGKRYKIIGGIARGLLYLHEESRLKIIHRDLKANNILLDGDMNPKISDFGMARLFAADETQAHTNRIVGTYGYMSPEYARYGHFSVKSDVFSFGVLVLEIVSGQKNISDQNWEDMDDLLNKGWKSWRQGVAENLIDPVLRTSSSAIHDMLRCIHIGLLCVQDNPVDRPTMSSVVLMLSSFSASLPPVPLEPRYSTVNRYNSSNAKNDMSVTEFYPR
ncbi:cysteine-rich receptor-like protein kinase 44 isoform X1 [Primulina eburnea]|uniref:cysteine-rich receptor-like protein kinase 44 isoform X1 n=1 Tax=Primulina eburnea TaxID=1245227 RepID=UPI003C6C3FCF